MTVFTNESIVYIYNCHGEVSRGFKETKELGEMQRDSEKFCHLAKGKIRMLKQFYP